MKKNKYKNIYEKYHQEVYQFAYYLIKDKTMTEQVMIRVFEKIFEDINYFLNIEKKSMWIIKQTKMTVVEYMRKEKKYFYFNEYKKETYTSNINTSGVDEEIIFKIINVMKVEERYVLYVIYYEKQSIKKCSEELMVEENVIKRIINKIQNKIDMERGRYRNEKY